MSAKDRYPAYFTTAGAFMDQSDYAAAMRHIDGIEAALRKWRDALDTGDEDDGVNELYEFALTAAALPEEKP